MEKNPPPEYYSHKVTPEEELKSTIISTIEMGSAISGELFGKHLLDDQKEIRFYGSELIAKFFVLFQLVKAHKPNYDWGEYVRFFTELAVTKRIDALAIIERYDRFLAEMNALGMMGSEEIVLDAFRNAAIAKAPEGEKDAS